MSHRSFESLNGVVGVMSGAARLQVHPNSQEVIVTGDPHTDREARLQAVLLAIERLLTDVPVTNEPGLFSREMRLLLPQIQAALAENPDP